MRVAVNGADLRGGGAATEGREGHRQGDDAQAAGRHALQVRRRRRTLRGKSPNPTTPTDRTLISALGMTAIESNLASLLVYRNQACLIY
jgi:hypothetical protein